MEELLQNIDVAFASAAFIATMGSFVVSWLIFKVLNAVAIKAEKLKKFMDGKLYKALQPTVPVLMGGIIGTLAFKFIGGDSAFVALLKGLVAGKLCELVFHMVKRYLKGGTENNS